jgi:hypothetical protein
MIKESGTRELNLDDKCDRCDGHGGWNQGHPHYPLFCECEKCNGYGKSGIKSVIKLKQTDSDESKG